MQVYKKFAPTGFDVAGLGLEDRQDWLVLEVSHTRDSGILAESNWDATVKALAEADPEENDHETHRFGHWGPGWFEVILVRPDSRAATVAEEIEGALSEYPVLDDHDYSERECDYVAESWRRSSVKERVELIQEDGGPSIFAARRDEVPQDSNGYLFDRLRREC